MKSVVESADSGLQLTNYSGDPYADPAKVSVWVRVFTLNLFFFSFFFLYSIIFQGNPQFFQTKYIRFMV